MISSMNWCNFTLHWQTFLTGSLGTVEEICISESQINIRLPVVKPTEILNDAIYLSSFLNSLFIKWYKVKHRILEIFDPLWKSHLFNASGSRGVVGGMGRETPRPIIYYQNRQVYQNLDPPSSFE